MKILLAVDGSAFTKKMLAYLTTHDKVFGPKNDYTLFSVQLPLTPRARAAEGKAVADGYHQRRKLICFASRQSRCSAPCR